MSIESHYQLARTLHLIAALPPLSFVAITAWLLPQLPPITPDQTQSYETIFLGITLLSAVLCDTMFYLRLRRFRALPNVGERARIPSLIEAKRGWRACIIAWMIAQVTIVFGVAEVFLTRNLNSIWVFCAFCLISLYRCRPRHGLFAASNWGSPRGESDE